MLTDKQLYDASPNYRRGFEDGVWTGLMLAVLIAALVVMAIA